MISELTLLGLFALLVVLAIAIPLAIPPVLSIFSVVVDRWTKYWVDWKWRRKP